MQIFRIFTRNMDSVPVNEKHLLPLAIFFVFALNKSDDDKKKSHKVQVLNTVIRSEEIFTHTNERRKKGIYSGRLM